MYFFRERSTFIFYLKNKITFSGKRNIIFPDNTRKIIFQCIFFKRQAFQDVWKIKIWLSVQRLQARLLLFKYIENVAYLQCHNVRFAIILFETLEVKVFIPSAIVPKIALTKIQDIFNTKIYQYYYWLILKHNSTNLNFRSENVETQKDTQSSSNQN